MDGVFSLGTLFALEIQLEPRSAVVTFSFAEKN